MSTLVRKEGEVWVEWHETVNDSRTVTTYIGSYADGRSVEMACEPYPVPVSLNGDIIRSFYDQGIWSLEEIEPVGGKIAVPFPVPEGKQLVGQPAYVEVGIEVFQQYQVEDIPPPPPAPTASEKVAVMLDAWGLSVEDLKGVLSA